MQYIKFLLFHLLAIISTISIVMGHLWMPIGFLSIVIVIIMGDLWLGEDLSVPQYRFPFILNIQLWLALPLLCLLIFVSLWSVSDSDILSMGFLLQKLTGLDVLSARDKTSWQHHLNSMLLTGLMIGYLGTVTGHELIHRKWGSFSHTIGRVLLSFSFDCSFAIEHVWGHHINIATPADPASAPRGRNVYQHIYHATIQGNINAWKIEQKRLNNLNLHPLSIHNRCLQGYAMSGVVLILAWVIAGAIGLVFIIVAGAIAKALLEIVNYMEHYGIVRVPGSVITPYHSWNTTSRISSWSLFNLTRHSHHHANAAVQFQNLKPQPDSPKMIGGYLATIALTLVPPLWYKLMQPKLDDWDRRYASKAEKQWIKEHL